MSTNKIFSTRGLYGLFALLAVGIAGYFSYQALDTSADASIQEAKTQSSVPASQEVIPTSTSDKINQPSAETYQPVANPATLGGEQPVIDAPVTNVPAFDEDEEDEIDCPTVNDEVIPGC